MHEYTYPLALFCRFSVFFLCVCVHFVGSVSYKKRFQVFLFVCVCVCSDVGLKEYSYTAKLSVESSKASKLLLVQAQRCFFHLVQSVQ